ncbi:GatB/YqeY domain-containing protein [Chloroflexales bacterium ZM16-3]|nr:GatB/YqeY domain-containing protein [Chloroflexales bacterium ZM16-3]
MTSIQDRLTADMKDAMRAGEKARLTVIRTTRAALQSAQLEAAKQRYDAAAREIEARHADDPAARDAALSAISADAHVVLDEADAEAVIAKEIKRRRDAAEIYRKASREDLASQEDSEAAILEAYLPKQMSVEELRPAVADLIAELGLSGPSSMGKLMPALMERFKGRAEGRLLSQVARELLAGT